MRCDSIDLGNGNAAIVCSRGGRRKRKCKCGQPATLECDHASETRPSGTCDAPICAGCARSVGPGIDHCRAHDPKVRKYRGEFTHPDTALRVLGLAAWTDGSGTLAITHAAIGVILALDGEVICEASEAIGLGTNNDAEVRAIGRALALAYAVSGYRRVPLTIYSDSEFAIGAVRHGSEWNVRRAELATLAYLVRDEVARWPQLSFVHVAGHSGNLGNERCDWLAGRARKQYLARCTP